MRWWKIESAGNNEHPLGLLLAAIEKTSVLSVAVADVLSLTTNCGTYLPCP
jgi:hypothetical protein